MQALTEYISGLTTDQGWNVGRPFHLFPWERRFLGGAFGQEFVQGDASLTLARGAGKTSFIATIGTATLTGPLVQERAETVICAPSLGQARITFGHVKYFLGAELENKKRWKVWDNAQTSLIEHRKTGQVLRCVGADPAGNEKLAKGTEGGRRMRARDDAAAATILSVAEGKRRWSEPPAATTRKRRRIHAVVG